MPEEMPDIQKIAEDLNWNGILDQMHEDHQKELAQDQEWYGKRYIHVHEIVTAFMTGLHVSATPVMQFHGALRLSYLPISITSSAPPIILTFFPNKNF